MDIYLSYKRSLKWHEIHQNSTVTLDSYLSSSPDSPSTHSLSRDPFPDFGAFKEVRPRLGVKLIAEKP